MAYADEGNPYTVSQTPGLLKVSSRVSNILKIKKLKDQKDHLTPMNNKDGKEDRGVDATTKQTDASVSAPCCDNKVRRYHLQEWHYVEQPDSDTEEKERVPTKIKAQSLVITLEVGGIGYKTYRNTLKQRPGTRLAKLMKDEPIKRHFFFDRNPELFNNVLDFHRTGQIHFPHNICRDRIEEEMEFWGINLDMACGSCFAEVFMKAEEQEFASKNLEKDFNWKTDLRFTEEDMETRQYRMFTTLDNPSSSRIAFMYGAFILICVFLSLITFIARTLKTALSPIDGDFESVINEAAQHDQRIKINEKAQDLLTYRFTPILIFIEYFTTFVFIFDLIARFILCPRKRLFLSSLINCLEIFCIVPLIVTFIIRIGFSKQLNNDIYLAIACGGLDTIKLLRTARVFRFTTRYSSLRVLVIALRNSLQEMMLLTVFICTGMVLFSSLIYYGEFWVSDSHFVSIPKGFWWAVVTMTTVGYGDMYPQSIGGYLIGGLCAISGIVFLALPIPIIGNNFGIYYAYAMERKQKAAAAREREQKRIAKQEAEQIVHDTTEEQLSIEGGKNSNMSCCEALRICFANRKAKSISPDPKDGNRSHGNLTFENDDVTGNRKNDENVLVDRKAEEQQIPTTGTTSAQGSSEKESRGDSLQTDIAIEITSENNGDGEVARSEEDSKPQNVKVDPTDNTGAEMLADLGISQSNLNINEEDTKDAKTHNNPKPKSATPRKPNKENILRQPSHLDHGRRTPDFKPKTK